jgi:hypothetical protein
MNSILTIEVDQKESFWERQFSASSTPPQTIFDVVFGILMPIICFYFDPGIIRGDFAFPVASAVFIYTFSLIAVVTLALWLVSAHRTGSLSGVFGGVFLCGALCSFVIGVIILPLTLIGIFVIIGFLGFVPFVTGFVYVRNGVRAINSRNAAIKRPDLVAEIAISALLVIGLPAVAHWGINKAVAQSIDEILSGDPSSTEGAAQRVRVFSPVADAGNLDRLVREYEFESDKERKERLAKAYMQVTGTPIEMRLAVLND